MACLVQRQTSQGIQRQTSLLCVEDRFKSHASKAKFHQLKFIWNLFYNTLISNSYCATGSIILRKIAVDNGILYDHVNMPFYVLAKDIYLMDPVSSSEVDSAIKKIPAINTG